MTEQDQQEYGVSFEEADPGVSLTEATSESQEEAPNTEPEYEQPDPANLPASEITTKAQFRDAVHYEQSLNDIFSWATHTPFMQNEVLRQLDDGWAQLHNSTLLPPTVENVLSHREQGDDQLRNILYADGLAYIMARTIYAGPLRTQIHSLINRRFPPPAAIRRIVLPILKDYFRGRLNLRERV